MLYIGIVSINVRFVRDPARFRSLYNVIQSSRIDIILAQESFLNGAASAEFESNFPQISITSNLEDGACGGSSIIINRNTSSWLLGAPPATAHTVCQDDEGRLLVCRILAKGRPLTIANVYAPAAETSRRQWFDTTTYSLQVNTLSFPCDIIGGDWNQMLTKHDHWLRRG